MLLRVVRAVIDPKAPWLFLAVFLALYGAVQFLPFPGLFIALAIPFFTGGVTALVLCRLMSWAVRREFRQEAQPVPAKDGPALQLSLRPVDDGRFAVSLQHDASVIPSHVAAMVMRSAAQDLEQVALRRASSMN